MPVSYTHLDVYKRQIREIVLTVFLSECNRQLVHIGHVLFKQLTSYVILF